MARFRVETTLAIVLIAQTGVASPMPCETVTKRADSAIVVNGSGELFDDVVVIELDETLCMSGTVFDTGEVGKVHLQGDGEPLLFSISLLKDGDESVLAVRHFMTGSLRCSFLRIPREGIALPEGEAAVGEDKTSTVRFRGTLERVGLRALRLEHRGSEPRIERLEQPRRLRMLGWSSGEVYGLIGSYWMNLPHLSRTLAGQGYATLPNLWPRSGLGFFMTFGSGFRVGSEASFGSISLAHLPTSIETDLASWGATGFVGWGLYRSERLTLDVAGGLSIDELGIKKRELGITSDVCDDGRVWAQTWALVLDHGSAYTVWVSDSIRLLLGYRVGYHHQVVGPIWSVKEEEAEGPSLDVSGARMRLWAGLMF